MSANYDRNDSFPSAGDISRVSAGTTIKGEISSPSDIRIDGNFEGRIFSQAKVVVGEKAVIKGDIVCNNADFWGKIEGNFFVKDTLSLKDTCVVDGDLHIRRLQVDLDASFNGQCKMITEDEFNQLTQGDQPAMYDVTEEKEADCSVGSSPFSPLASSEEEIPEA